MPDWFIRIAQKIQSLFGLLQKKPFANDALVPHSSEVTNIQAAFNFSATEPKVTIQINSKEATINFPSLKLIDNFRIFMQNDWSINLGYNSKFCINKYDLS